MTIEPNDEAGAGKTEFTPAQAVHVQDQVDATIAEINGHARALGMPDAVIRTVGPDGTVGFRLHPQIEALCKTNPDVRAMLGIPEQP